MLLRHSTESYEQQAVFSQLNQYFQLISAPRFLFLNQSFGDLIYKNALEIKAKEKIPYLSIEEAEDQCHKQALKK